MLVDCDYFRDGGVSCLISCVGIGVHGPLCGLSGLYIDKSDSWFWWDLGAWNCDRFTVTEVTGLSAIGLVEVGCRFGYEEIAGPFGMWLPSLSAQETVGACWL